MKFIGNPPDCKCEEIGGVKVAFDEIHWYCRPWYLSTTSFPTPVPVPICNGKFSSHFFFLLFAALGRNCGKIYLGFSEKQVYNMEHIPTATGVHAQLIL